MYLVAKNSTLLIYLFIIYTADVRNGTATFLDFLNCNIEHAKRKQKIISLFSVVK
jgi:hypothetical protein